jgi:hypothetical protein
MGFSDWISASSVIIASVALVVSGVTLIYTRRQLRFAANDSATDLVLQMGQVFLEYPLVRPYVYQNAQPPTEETNPEMHHRVEATGMFCLDVLECVWHRREHYRREDRASWRELIHDIFAGSPAVRALYVENQEWYPMLRRLRESRVCSHPSEHTFFSGGTPD